jgi:uncharacterized protein YabE (DUF348 family)
MDVPGAAGPWLGRSLIPDTARLALVYSPEMVKLLDHLRNLPGSRLKWSAAALAMLSLVFLFQAASAEVTLTVDGRSRQVATHARTVGGVLHQMGVPLAAGDRLYPSADQPVTGGMLIEVDHARAILIEHGDDREWVRSADRQAGTVLSQAGFEVFPGDQVSVNGLPMAGISAGSLPLRIRLIQGISVPIVVDGAASVLHSAAPTLGQALWEAGIALFQGDQLTPDAETPLTQVVSVEMQRAHQLRVRIDGIEVQARAVGPTVGEALAQAGVNLIGLDYSVPSFDAALPADGGVRVVRVEEQVIVEQKPLPFETALQPVPDLELDQQRVLSTGSYGVTASRIRVRYEDGIETARTAESSWTARQPENRVIGYGTKVVPRVLNTNDGPFQYCRAIQMYATSYSPSRAGTPANAPWFGITASGKKLVKGLVAIDRRYIPFGTIMYIQGYGHAEAADTGGGVKGRWIDLGYSDSNYVNWHQYVTVYFQCPLSAGLAPYIP